MKTYLLLATVTAAAASAQEPVPADPFAPAGARMQPVRQVETGIGNVSTCFETFSIPLDMAASFQRERLGDADLYARIVPELGKEIQLESLSVIRSKSGQKATTESITEQIYPTEWHPPEMPNSVGVAVSKAWPGNEKLLMVDPEVLENAPDPNGISGLQSPTTPKSLETRNVGATLEIEATINEQQTMIDLRMVPEIVTFVGRSTWGEGGARIETPTFESQRINTNVTVRIGEPCFLGTLSRPPVSEVDEDSANRVWFAFVTVTLAKP